MAVIFSYPKISAQNKRYLLDNRHSQKTFFTQKSINKKAMHYFVLKNHFSCKKCILNSVYVKLTQIESAAKVFLQGLQGQSN
jgi:hypothetical protein